MVYAYVGLWRIFSLFVGEIKGLVSCLSCNSVAWFAVWVSAVLVSSASVGWLGVSMAPGSYQYNIIYL